jgi:hypothetical protein
MITLILPDPPSTVIKGIQYLQTEGDLISYELSVNTSELVEAQVIFRDYKGFRYIVALLDEKINLDLAG